jgi:hypothetical protein
MGIETPSSEELCQIESAKRRMRTDHDHLINGKVRRHSIHGGAMTVRGHRQQDHIGAGNGLGTCRRYCRIKAAFDNSLARERLAFG